MQKKNLRILAVALSFSMLLGGVSLPSIKASAEEVKGEWKEETVTKEDSKYKGQKGWFWYENGVKQGTEGRGKEISDPGTKDASGQPAWFWLDAEDGGKRAAGKDVYLDSDAGKYADELEAKGKGKWCRYDADSMMLKGWAKGDGVDKASESISSPDDAGDEPVYYFDEWSGAMAKGIVLIGGKLYSFDTVTGQLIKDKTQDKPEGFKETGWNTVDGIECFFFEGVKQGVFGRGKEICDPETNQWFWLDSDNGGQKAVDKDVFIEVGGESKWVRYDKDGQMVKGWNEKDGKKFYFDPITGEMAKGVVEVDGKWYKFNDGDGVCEGETEAPKQEEDKTEADKDKDKDKEETDKDKDKEDSSSEDTSEDTSSETTEKTKYTTYRNVKTTSYRDDEITEYTVRTYPKDGDGYPYPLEEHTYKVDKDGKETETSHSIYQPKTYNTLEYMYVSEEYVEDENGYNVEDEDGNYKKVNVIYVTKYEYGKDGYQTSYIQTKDGENYRKAEFTREKYDNGNTKKLVSVYFKVDEKGEWVYDSRNTSEYDEKGYYELKDIYEVYNAKTGKWVLNYRYEYERNDQGQRTKESRYYWDSINEKEYLEEVTTYQYKTIASSSYTALQETIVYKSNGSEKHHYKYEHEYDDEGRELKQTNWSLEETYDSKTDEYVLGKDFYIMSWEEYKYDDKGHQTENNRYSTYIRSVSDSDGNRTTKKEEYLQSHTVYTYTDYEYTLEGSSGTNKGSSQTAYDNYYYYYEYGYTDEEGNYVDEFRTKLNSYYGYEYFYNKIQIQEKQNNYSDSTDYTSEEAAKKNRILRSVSEYSYSDDYMTTRKHADQYAYTTVTTYYTYDEETKEVKEDYVQKRVNEYEKMEYYY